MKRMISTDLWESRSFRSIKDIETRYLWLYLLTTPKSSVSGIFYLPIDTIAIHTKFSEEKVEKLLATLIDMKLCCYSRETEEIAIYNYAKYNISNLGKPMLDLLKRDLGNVKNKKLIRVVALELQKYATDLFDDEKKEKFNKIVELYINNNIHIDINSDTGDASCHDTLNSDEELEKLLEEFK